MYESLVEQAEFHIFMLCFDEECVKEIETLCLKHATVIPLESFEAGDRQLIEVKKNRTRLEYYYTCGPSLPLYVLNNYLEVDLITYLDADLFFYSDPQILLDEMNTYSIGITYQRFPQFGKEPKTGRFNVGWLSFRRDDNGIACLEWWRKKCIEWCYERFEDGKYADQLYLDEWPKLFKGVKVLNNKGANVAPWNVIDYDVRRNNDQVIVSGYQLVFYHFHGFKQITRHLFNTNLGLTFRFPNEVLKNNVYKPYITKLLSNTYSQNVTQSIRNKKIRASWIQIIRNTLRTVIGIIFRQYVIYINNKIY